MSSSRIERSVAGYNRLLSSSAPPPVSGQGIVSRFAELILAASPGGEKEAFVALRAAVFGEPEALSAWLKAQEFFGRPLDGLVATATAKSMAGWFAKGYVMREHTVNAGERSTEPVSLAVQVPTSGRRHTKIGGEFLGQYVRLPMVNVKTQEKVDVRMIFDGYGFKLHEDAIGV